MFHVVARGRGLLFTSWEEGRALFRRVAGVPGVVAACVMPDHLHLVLAHDDAGGRVTVALGAYARWRNHRRGELGPVWAERPAPERIPDARHAARTVRYVHLNPCRAGLARDPLEWPLSTHRDRVGLAFPAVVPLERDPERFHRYVSGDPTTAVAGTPFPAAPWGEVAWPAIVDAVGGVCRLSAAEVLDQRRARGLLLATAFVHGHRDLERLAELAGCDRTTAWRRTRGVQPRGGHHRDPALAACVRVVEDPRFVALGPVDLRRLPGWGRYARRG